MYLDKLQQILKLCQVKWCANSMLFSLSKRITEVKIHVDLFAYKINLT